MDSIFEVQRQTHEEVERYERALYTLLSRNQPTHEGKLQTEHKASQILDRISSKATTLNTLYQDKDTIKAEADRISSASRPDDLTEFYSRLVKIQEYHAKYPDSAPGGLDLEIAAFLDEPGQEDEEYEEEDRACSVLQQVHVLMPYSHLIALLWRGILWQIRRPVRAPCRLHQP